MVQLALVLLAVVGALGMPVALAILGATLFYYLTNDSLPTMLVFQAFETGIESFPLLAIPFFIMAGEIMNTAGLTSRLVRLAESVVGHLTGGLAHVNVITNTLMGGLSGSSNADAAAISKTLVPEMTKRGYDKSWSVALTAAGSIIGPIIPPGIGLILYGFLANVSIGKLFIGGILPGVLLAIALMIAVHITSKKRGYTPSRERMASLKEIRQALIQSFWALLLPIVIIGGIRFGVFTPTEAAAVAVVYALFVGFFVYRSIKLKDMAQVLASSVRVTGVIMFVVASANAFGRMLSWERIPHHLAEWMVSLSSNPYVILLIINIGLLILGCFAEGTANLIIMTPLLVPIVDKLGIDPVAFGVVVVLNLTIGGITPPLGTMMYTTCSLNRVSTTAYTKQVWPFIIAVVSVLFLITYIPEFITFLPDLFYGKPS